MQDITKCTGVDCPKKEECFRYTAEPSYYQSYFSVEPFNRDTKQFFCEMFWNNKIIKNER